MSGYAGVPTFDDRMRDAAQTVQRELAARKLPPQQPQDELEDEDEKLPGGGVPK